MQIEIRLLMLPEWLIKYVGGGVLVIIVYVLISNIFWLLFGSKVLQSFPGINIKGATGTFRIALMLVMSLIGFLVWAIRFPFSLIGIIKKKSLQTIISLFIQSASRTFHKVFQREK